MRTNSLKDLKKVRNRFPVYRTISVKDSHWAKPNVSTITSQVFAETELDVAAQHALRVYRHIINNNKSFIMQNLCYFYGNEIYINESKTTDVYLKIKDIISTCNKSCMEIKEILDNYIGEKGHYLRLYNGTLIPCSLSRIHNAILAMNEGKSPEEVKNILYN